MVEDDDGEVTDDTNVVGREWDDSEPVIGIPNSTRTNDIDRNPYIIFLLNEKPG